MQIPESKTSEKATGLVLPTEEKLSSLLQSFTCHHADLVRTAQRQNTLVNRTLLALTVLLSMLAATGLAFLYYHYEPLKRIRQEVKGEVEANQTRQRREWRQIATLFEKNYRQDIEKMFAQSHRGSEQLLAYLMRLQTQQRKVKQDYEKELLAAAKQRLSLEQTLKELTAKLTKAELSIMKLEARNKTLNAKAMALQKQKREYERRIKALQRKVAEKLSPKELEMLKKDLEDDGLDE